jgi:hypothetical protein
MNLLRAPISRLALRAAPVLGPGPSAGTNRPQRRSVSGPGPSPHDSAAAALDATAGGSRRFLRTSCATIG